MNDSELRTKAYRLLIELEQATTGMMTAISAKEAAKANHDAAVSRQQNAFAAWGAFLDSPSDDPNAPQEDGVPVRGD